MLKNADKVTDNRLARGLNRQKIGTGMEQVRYLGGCERLVKAGDCDSQDKGTGRRLGRSRLWYGQVWDKQVIGTGRRLGQAIAWEKPVGRHIPFLDSMYCTVQSVDYELLLIMLYVVYIVHSMYCVQCIVQSTMVVNMFTQMMILPS
jgi:hypothetical protein